MPLPCFISQGVLVCLNNSEFERVEVPTMNTLCKYFSCGVCDLLEYVPVEVVEQTS